MLNACCRYIQIRIHRRDQVLPHIRSIYFMFTNRTFACAVYFCSYHPGRLGIMDEPKWLRSWRWYQPFRKARKKNRLLSVINVCIVVELTPTYLLLLLEKGWGEERIFYFFPTCGRHFSLLYSDRGLSTANKLREIFLFMLQLVRGHFELHTRTYIWMNHQWLPVWLERMRVVFIQITHRLPTVSPDNGVCSPRNL